MAWEWILKNSHLLIGVHCIRRSRGGSFIRDGYLYLIIRFSFLLFNVRGALNSNEICSIRLGSTLEGEDLATVDEEGAVSGRARATRG